MKKPKLEKLIQEIAMFDMDAAYKLHQHKDNEAYSDCNYIEGVIDWEETEEGCDYWIYIYGKLQERRKKHHPHRDLMIEFANDRTISIETFMSEKWVECKEPSFYKDVKYRKKPKVTKKVIEYRIYLDTENEIHMIEAEHQIPSDFKKWIVEWEKVEIEVEEND